MKTLIKDYQTILNNLGQIYQRDIYESLESKHRIVGIVGPRGVGKTTYILNYLKKNYGDSKKALYVTADDMYFVEHNLLDLVKKFVEHYDGELLCIDEIHRYPNWSQELKNIYDKYRNIKIIFSGSSSINLIKEKYDLSRRAMLKNLPGFSFREYLEIRLNKKFPILTLDDIIKKRDKNIKDLTFEPKLLGLFDEYLRGGYYPIFLELNNDNIEVAETLFSTIDTVIHVDIAAYYKIKTETLPIFKKILYFIYSSSPSSMNVNRLAKSLGKDHSDVARYLEMMRDSGLLRFLLIDNVGHALVRNTEKIYLNNANLFYAVDNEVGKCVDKGSVRELFVLTMMENSKLKPSYSKKGDLRCGEFIFEIGGRNKTMKQIAGIKNAYLIKDDELMGGVHSIPLYLFGFLY